MRALRACGLVARRLHRLALRGPDSVRLRRHLRSMLGDTLFLGLEQLGEVFAGDEAVFDQDVADASRIPAGLAAGDLRELIHRDHLEVDGQSPQQRNRSSVAHQRALSAQPGKR